MSFRKTALLITIFLLIAAVAALAQQGPQEILKAQGYLSTDKLQAGSTFRLAVALDVRNGFHANSATSTAGWPAKLTIKP
jgi:hypothetical protein